MMLTGLANFLFPRLLLRVATRRPPDFVVGANAVGGAYLERWHLTPWRRWQSAMRGRAQAKSTRARKAAAWAAGLLPNLYLHCFLRDDDARALHDHPSCAVSLMLHGRYIEHTIDAGGIHQRRELRAGALRYLPASRAHRIELARPGGGYADPCWTLFLFGPVVRNWGFHCPQRGWVRWEDFTASDKPGEIGPGCDA